MQSLLCGVLVLSLCTAAPAAVLRVGEGREFATIQAAIDAVTDGGTILIDALETDEILAFPRLVPNVTLAAAGDAPVRIGSLDTWNAPGLTVQGLSILRGIEGGPPFGIKIRSNGVRIFGFGCEGVDGPCILAPAPVSRILIQGMYTESVWQAIVANGTEWALLHNHFFLMSPASLLERVAVKVTGDRMVLRGNVVWGVDGDMDYWPGTCYSLRATGTQTLLLEDNWCEKARKGFVVTGAGHVTLRNNVVWVLGSDAVDLFATTGQVLVANNRLVQVGSCGVDMERLGAGVTIRGNVVAVAKYAYCHYAATTAQIVDNLLQSVTYPAPGPSDLLE